MNILAKYTNLNEPTGGTYVGPSAAEEISNQISIKPDRKAAIDTQILLFGISVSPEIQCLLVGVLVPNWRSLWPSLRPSSEQLVNPIELPC